MSSNKSNPAVERDAPKGARPLTSTLARGGGEEMKEDLHARHFSYALAKLQQLVIVGVLALVGQLHPTTARAEPTDMTTDFLEGEVQIIDFNYQVTRFRLVKNNAVVDVRNDIHIRIVDNPYNLPKTFPILAPMTAVDIVDGEIPSSYIRKYTLKHYIALREKYDRHAPQSASSPAPEIIINKQDADYIFSLNRGEWEAYAKRMVHPDGWKVRLSPHDTGTGVMSFDANTGLGLSVQPLYSDDKGPPTMLIVGSYYPLGFLPDFTDAFKISLEKDASDDLGPAYSVTASYTKIPTSEGIELMVTKK